MTYICADFSHGAAHQGERTIHGEFREIELLRWPHERAELSTNVTLWKHIWSPELKQGGDDVYRTSNVCF